MTRPLIPAAPIAPARTMDGADFSAAADSFAGYIEQMPGNYNALADWMDKLAASFAKTGFAATSTSSVTMGTGSKTFTIQPDRAFSPGQTVVIARTSDATKLMMGTVTSFSGTTLTVNVASATTSGTYSDWSIALSVTADPYAYMPGRQGANLVPNGGFEYGLDGYAINSGGGGTAVSDNMWGRQVSLYNSTFTAPFPWIITDFIDVAPLTEYTASHDAGIFMPAGASGTPQVYIDAVYFKANGDEAGESLQNPLSGPSDFDNAFSRRKAGAITFTTPAGVTKLKLRVVVDPNDAAISLAFCRRIQLENGPTPTLYNNEATILKMVRDIGTKAPASGATLTWATIYGGTINNAAIERARFGGQQLLSSTAVVASNLDFSLDNTFSLTVAGALALTVSNAPTEGVYDWELELTFTSGSVAWPASFVWNKAIPPTLTAGKTYLISGRTRGGATHRVGYSEYAT